jgi:bifunctional N-acetylglucosamine-1-phosphate-uridyltransferase/glucosamine-1-phosphate-acetyltransferase GlmU-like protein
MINHVVCNILGLDQIQGAVLVLNRSSSKKIRDVLTCPFPLRKNRLKCVTQPERKGAADAVWQALTYLGDETEHVLVTFADMPLWQPATLSGLIGSHERASEDPNVVMSMVTMQVSPTCPEARFGRIIKDDNGAIRSVVEPGSGFTPPPLANGRVLVNPSLYVFRTAFLKQTIPSLLPHAKDDGYPAEQQLPDLIGLAHRMGKAVNEFPLLDPAEAWGVNTAAELERVELAYHLLFRPQLQEV